MTNPHIMYTHDNSNCDDTRVKMHIRSNLALTQYDKIHQFGIRGFAEALQMEVKVVVS